jgi:hypothetical protein
MNRRNQGKKLRKQISRKKRFREAGSGQFVTRETAERYPKETVSETIKPRLTGPVGEDI